MKFTKFFISILFANLFLVILSVERYSRSIENNETNGTNEVISHQSSQCCGNSGTIFKSLQKQIKAVIEINKNKNKKLEEQKATIKNEVVQINKILDEIQANTRNLLDEKKRKEEERKNIAKYILNRSQILKNLNELNKIKGSFFRSIFYLK